MHKSQEFLHIGNAAFYRYNIKVIFVIKNPKKAYKHSNMCGKAVDRWQEVSKAKKEFLRSNATADI